MRETLAMPFDHGRRFDEYQGIEELRPHSVERHQNKRSVKKSRRRRGRCRPSNDGPFCAPQLVEPRAGTKGNVGQQSTCRALDRESVSQALDRMRQVARQRRKERFTALHHHIDIDLLRTAFFALKRDICFQYRLDAFRVQNALSGRLARFGLTLEPNKTKLVEFGRFARRYASKYGRKRPETIYFLGLTLYCTRNLKGNFKVGMCTEKSRMRRSITSLQDLMRQMRHLTIREQVDHLNVALRGHYAYYLAS
jgi:hypothetical protein